MALPTKANRKAQSPVERFLISAGARTCSHGPTGTLFDHLMNTRTILESWAQPEWVCDAGALHSIYSTDVYRTKLVPWSARAKVRALVGAKAERLVYLFCALSRDQLFKALESREAVSRETLRLLPRPDAPARPLRLSRKDIVSLLAICRANEAEQSEAPRIFENERLQSYIRSFTDHRSAPGKWIYPGLRARAWHDPAVFPVTRALEKHAEEVRAEALALDRQIFHRESEPIRRSGSWNVFILYERGRKNLENCLRCPRTTQIIEEYPAVRTLAGLIYFSRLGPGAHISPHRGPTNMRVRCHLGIKIPRGDCRLRVGRETRGWEQGKCFVFDDHFEHESWNRTRQSRIALVVDLWHPDLLQDEIALLEGLHRYAYTHAEDLNQYWSNNLLAKTQL